MISTNNEIAIYTEKPLYDFDRSLMDHKEITFASQRGFSGTEAEFLAIVTLSGIVIKSVSDVVIAMIKRGENVEITMQGKTVKGLTYSKAKEIFAELQDEDESKE